MRSKRTAGKSDDPACTVTKGKNNSVAELIAQRTAFVPFADTGLEDFGIGEFFASKMIDTICPTVPRFADAKLFDRIISQTTFGKIIARLLSEM